MIAVSSLHNMIIDRSHVVGQFAVRMLLAVLLVWLGACHNVVLETPSSLRLSEPRSERSAVFVVDEDSRKLSFSTGGTTAGLAHRFRLEVGVSLDRYGRAYCAQAFASGSELEVNAEILDFSIGTGAAHLVCNFRVLDGGRLLFEKKYEVSGPPRPGLPGNPLPEMVGGVASEGSVSAIKNSLQRTLHDVLTLTLQSFFSDLQLRLNSADKQAVVAGSN
ncbi:MAG: hypothetical protein ACI8TQ_001848 [Planctomycetota bacterium]|jgi:hypothetical protein